MPRSGHLWRSSLLFCPWYFPSSFLLGCENYDELLRKECWAFSVAPAVGKRSKEEGVDGEHLQKGCALLARCICRGLPCLGSCFLIVSLSKSVEKSKRYCCRHKLISPSVSRAFMNSPHSYLTMVSESSDPAFLWDLHLIFY